MSESKAFRGPVRSFAKTLFGGVVLFLTTQALFSNYLHVNPNSQKKDLTATLEKTDLRPKNNDTMAVLNSSKRNERFSHLSGQYKRIMEWFHIQNKSDEDFLLNQHKYSFSINSDLCLISDPDVVFLIHSAAHHTDRRNLIRRTWAKVKVVKGVYFGHVFLVAQTLDRRLQRALFKEAEQHGDIVQGNFFDSYKNLTYKHVMGYDWALSKCQQVNLFAKLDDDVLVNVYNLAEYVLKYGFGNNFIYCDILEDGYTYREETSKWRVTRQVYPFERYPRYCAGAAYLISPDVMRALYKASEDTRFYWVDDVYVTGILALKVDQNLTAMEEFYGIGRMKSRYKSRVNNFMFFLGQNLWEVMWKAILETYGVIKKTVPRREA